MQTVIRSELLKVLDKVSVGIASKELIEQSASFIFTDDSVCTFNEEIFATAKIDLQIKGAIEAAPLLSILKKVNKKELQIWEENGELRIKKKNLHVGIALDSELNLPIHKIKIPKKFKKAPTNFNSLCELACLTANKTETDTLLSCVHLNDDQIEACDQGRVTVCYFDSDTDIQAVLTANNLLKIIKKEKISGIAQTENWIHFQTITGLILSCTTVDQEFMDIESFFPDNEKETEIKLPEDIILVLDKAETFCKDDISLERSVSVTINKKEIVIHSKNYNGWFDEKIPLKNTMPTLTFSINPTFLKNAIALSNTINVTQDYITYSDEQIRYLIQIEKD